MKQNIAIVNFIPEEKKKSFEFVKEVVLERKTPMETIEAYQIYSLVKSICAKRKGNLAEVGVYTGGTAKLMCEGKGKNNLYLFDTFEGLPEITKEDMLEKSAQIVFAKGEFKKENLLDDVKNYLKDYSNVFFCKGLFPQKTSKEINKKKFIFVHLDVDLYKSTLDCLKFFYPRMEGGNHIKP